MTGLVSAIVQLFFAWRIWVLKPDSIVAHCLSMLVVVVALLQSSSAFAGGIKFALASNIEQFAALTPVVKIWLSGSFVCDILIAGSMIWILTAARSSSAFKRTDSLITKLIIHTVETGAITAVTALAELILFIKMDTNFVHEVPALLLGKLYSNVVLATLNGRLRARSSHVPSDGINTTEGVDSHQLSLRANYYSRDTDRDKTVIHVSTDIQDDLTTRSNFKERV
ncbi:hypothetical protein HYPSUDRAFT_36463 [Hypholoma sublateritium FD-334 SS-4]|uniref:DUF6534 domain-containing protein n=1 Tax=Hypholoma sublateritium (strain FD-334 SS-4) TaxID=945553 RepID=A0A0D2Q3P4_HYPSF|nr:hypothetical protein HYPSUDRAFT_36463 [Hypholoma sublateritium FD-334 SS-4]